MESAAQPLAETPLEKLDAVREWVKDGIAETLASEGGEFMLGIESASVLAALDDIGEALREINRLRAALARVTGYEGAEIDALLEEYDRGR